MAESNTFLGEVSIFHAQVPDAEFGAFEKIPNLASINRLAHEFSEFLELMPYQQLGNNLEINLSIYLKPVYGDGRVIAIVAREAFPVDFSALVLIIEKGIRHLELLAEGIGFRFEKSSIELAAEKLNALLCRIDELQNG